MITTDTIPRSDTPFHLSGKTILVTGATSGIGMQTVKSIIAMGGKVLVAGRNPEKLGQVADTCGSAVIQQLLCDFTQEAQIRDLAAQAKPIDGLVHCAGLVTPYPIRYLSFQKMDETMHLNFYSAFSLVAQLDQKKKLLQGASLVFISSISARHPHKGGSAYGASKAALESFSKVVALEYAHRGIRSNCILPAMVHTPLYEKASEEAGHDSMQAHIEKYPLGIGQPEDVANAAVYLLSPASRWMTGSEITLDGGCLLGY